MPAAPWFKQIAGASRRRKGRAWRAVEAQHRVSTMRLVGNHAGAQELLERILEENKPPVPEECADLPYLLATPFRYRPVKGGSRFRAWPAAGVLYGAEQERTACAELGYWRWRFVQDSEGVKELAAAAQTVFSFGYAGSGLDLREDPLRRWRRVWEDPKDYRGCQELAEEAIRQGEELILYRSVRDGEKGMCVAVLRGKAIRPRRVIEQQTWYLTVTEGGAVWQREQEDLVFRYRESF